MPDDQTAAAEAPPAHDAVAHGCADETEARIQQLESELEAERAGRKKDQVRLAELEDELHQLRQAGMKPPPRRPPAARTRGRRRLDRAAVTV